MSVNFLRTTHLKNAYSHEQRTQELTQLVNEQNNGWAKKEAKISHHLGINYYVNFLGRLGSNRFQLIQGLLLGSL